MIETLEPPILETNSEGATKPVRGNELGYDLFIKDYTQLSHGALVSTGCRIEIPNGHVGLICSKWSLASQNILVLNQPNVLHPGLIEDLKVLVNSVGNLTQGDAIAQLVIISAYYPYA